MIQNVTEGVSNILSGMFVCMVIENIFNLAEKVRGWKLIIKTMPRIIDYGRSEGILQSKADVITIFVSSWHHEFFRVLVSTFPVLYWQRKKKLMLWKRRRMEIKYTMTCTNQLDGVLSGESPHQWHNCNAWSHSLSAGSCCSRLSISQYCNSWIRFDEPINANIGTFYDLSGTILSGILALCMGQPRINMKVDLWSHCQIFWSFQEGRKLVTLVVNFLVGIAQFFTITFLFVGWFWSIAWGGLLIIHSSKNYLLSLFFTCFAVQYREALQQRRQEAVATAAIEALTKVNIKLHWHCNIHQHRFFIILQQSIHYFLSGLNFASTRRENSCEDSQTTNEGQEIMKSYQSTIMSINTVLNKFSNIERSYLESAHSQSKK